MFTFNINVVVAVAVCVVLSASKIPPCTVLWSPLCRETSLLCHQSPSTSSPPPSSLPSLHPVAPPTNPALYGSPSDDDLHGLLKPHLISMSSADFLLGFLRLCLAVSSAHKGVVSRVSVVQLSTVHPVTCYCNTGGKSAGSSGIQTLFAVCVQCPSSEGTVAHDDHVISGQSCDPCYSIHVWCWESSSCSIQLSNSS